MTLKGFGGVEQAFLNLNKAIERKGHEVLSLISKNAEVSSKIPGKRQEITIVSRMDFIAMAKIKWLLINYKPDAIIVHSNKEASIISKVAGKTPTIVVSHNYNFKRIDKRHYIFAITKHMQNAIIESGWSQDKVIYLPNIVHVDKPYVVLKPSKKKYFWLPG